MSHNTTTLWEAEDKLYGLLMPTGDGSAKLQVLASFILRKAFVIHKT
jgi:hypothetical protein